MLLKTTLRNQLHLVVTNGPLDSLLLQEHKLDFGQCNKSGKLLCGHTFWSSAVGTKGGVCIIVMAIILSHVIGRGVIMLARAQWSIIMRDGLKVGILNV